MNPIRHIIICEGASERIYLQRLQSFLASQPARDGMFSAPLQIIPPSRAQTGNGRYSSVVRNYRKRFKEAPRTSCLAWVDFDLYHRNYKGNADAYKRKSITHPKIPDFLFSFHNFEDFLALHLEDDKLSEWKRIFQQNGHFDNPLHADDYIEDFRKIWPAYRKGDLPVDFISQDSLKRLKRNKASQPGASLGNMAGYAVNSFADFLVEQIETVFPSLLT